VRLTSPGKRLAGYALETVLFFVTLIIGWFIWALVTARSGQSPAKQVLGMRVVHLSEAEAATFWRTVGRGLAKWALLGVASSVAFVPYFWLLWDRQRQQLWDKIADTAVMDDPQGALLRREETAPAPRALREPPVVLTTNDYLEEKLRRAEAEHLHQKLVEEASRKRQAEDS
jgi:uncharacterized RDD family membrane protein YckC